MRKYTFEKVQSYIVILIIKKERKSMQAKKFLATLLAVTMTAAPTASGKSLRKTVLCHIVNKSTALY